MTTTYPSSWWRLTLRTTDDGSVTVESCERVEAADLDEGNVVFVQAATDKQARDLAILARRRRWRREYDRRQREQRRAAGLCPECGKAGDRGAKPCTACKDRNTANWRERQRTGGPLPTEEHSGRVRAGIERKRQAGQAAFRLEILTEVRNAWAKSATVDDFARWLAAEIAKLTEAA